MIKVGLTGGIGSGKSTVAKIFQSLNIPVYLADDKAKSLMNSNAELIKSIQDLFGEESYQNNTLNREYLAEKVFQDANLLKELNALVHPAVHKDLAIWFSSQNSEYAICEAALLIENASYKNFDVLLVVAAEETLRINRVMQRDQVEEKLVRNRLQHQLPQEDKIALADFVIHNNENELLIPQVIAIHEKILKWQK